MTAARKRGCWKTRNAQERNGTEQNGTEQEVIDAQYGRGHWIRVGKLVLMCQLINVWRAHLTSCTSHKDRTSTQQTVHSYTKHIKHSSRLPGIFVRCRDPSLTSEGSAMPLPSLGSAVGSGVTCGLPGFCTLHKYETSITTECPLSC